MDTGDPASLAVFPGHNLISGTHCWPGTPLSWVTINFTHSVACEYFQHLTCDSQIPAVNLEILNFILIIAPDCQVL